MKETLCDIELLEKRGGSVGCIETLKEEKDIDQIIKITLQFFSK
jgi:hypothetical protein